MNIEEILYTASVWVLPVVMAITIHEAAHGFVAWRFGDDTAYRAGRVTFNPIRHVDPFGTLLLPGLLLLMTGGRFLFGFAKPVPVDFTRLRNPRRDMILVAAAGPGVNLLLAILSALLIHVAALLPTWFGEWAIQNLANSILINLVLAVFNMIPLPPLDGGRVAVGLLPYALARWLAKLERWGFLIIIAALFILPSVGNWIGIELNFLTRWLFGTVQFLIQTIATITGLQ